MILGPQIQSLIEAYPVKKVLDIYDTPYGRVCRTWPRFNKRPPTAAQLEHWGRIKHSIKWRQNLPPWVIEQWKQINPDPTRSWDDVMRRVWWSQPSRTHVDWPTETKAIYPPAAPVFSATWITDLSRFYILCTVPTQIDWPDDWKYYWWWYAHAKTAQPPVTRFQWLWRAKNCYLGRRKRDSYIPSIIPWSSVGALGWDGDRTFWSSTYLTTEAPFSLCGLHNTTEANRRYRLVLSPIQTFASWTRQLWPF